MSTGLKANPDGSAAIQVGGTDVITLTSGGAATFVTSPTTVQAGTAAAPSITFSGDTNTGIYSPGADTIAFTEGGVESMRITSAGDVGIGTTSPGRKLDVVAISAAANQLNGMRLQMNGVATSLAEVLLGTDGGGVPFTSLRTGNDSNSYVTFFTGSGPTERMRLDAGGNLGVGETSPLARIHAAIPSVANTNTEIFRLTDNVLCDFKVLLNRQTTLGTSIARVNTAAGIMSFETNNTERARFDSSGRFMIGATSSDYALRVNNTAHFGDAYDAGIYGMVQISRPANQGTSWHISFVRSGQQVAGIGYVNNSSTFLIANNPSNSGNGMTLGVNANSWGTQSDERKKNILGYIEDAVSKVATLRTVFFEYKNDEEKKRRVGFIAQDVQSVLPEAVHVDDDPDQTLNLQYSDLIPLLTKAIQEQQAMIDELKAKVAALEGA